MKTKKMRLNFTKGT